MNTITVFFIIVCGFIFIDLSVFCLAILSFARYFILFFICTSSPFCHYDPVFQKIIISLTIPRIDGLDQR